MAINIEQFEQRKQDHIKFALSSSTQAEGATGLDRVQLIHDALPELDFADLSVATRRLDQPVHNPFIVSSMTAGHQDGKRINAVLAEACCAQEWWMGVGSQRRELSDPTAAQEWLALRRSLPRVKLMGNIGITQLITAPLAAIQRLAESLQAEAMIVHTNPLQECLQPEGTPQFKGALQALTTLCRELAIPVVLKETGCGFSAATLVRLATTGIAAVDLSGYGGTHWGRIEGLRASNPTDPAAQAAETFKHWGIATVDALLAARHLDLPYEIWGSGGLRSGLDAAKALALGARTIGFAKPLLEAALISVDAVVARMAQYEYELKIALFCTGSENLTQLQGKCYDIK